MKILQNSVCAVLGYTYLRNKDFKRFNFEEANFVGSDLSGSNFEAACLFGTRFRHALLVGSLLKNTNAQFAHFAEANLTNANLIGSNLKFASFQKASLINADLSNTDLTDADLSGANLTGANLKGAIGLGTKEAEIGFAKRLLEVLDSGKGQLEMDNWHTCETTHCLAGWAFPNSPAPAMKASTLYPTLAQYFFAETNEEALEALELVASGKLSVFPD